MEMKEMPGNWQKGVNTWRSLKTFSHCLGKGGVEWRGVGWGVCNMCFCVVNGIVPAVIACAWGEGGGGFSRRILIVP